MKRVFRSFCVLGEKERYRERESYSESEEFESAAIRRGGYNCQTLKKP